MNFDTSLALKRIQAIANDFWAQLPNILLGVVVFVLFLFIARGVRTLVRRLNEQYRRGHSLGLVLGRLAQGGIILIGLLIALVIAVPSFKPAQLVQFLGLSSVAIGFAFQDIFKNFLAGILLLIAQPFRIGDQIVVGSFEGTVEEIQTRATFIRTYDGRRVVIPNAEIFNDSVVVNTAFDKRRLEYDIGIGYGDDIERARRIVLDTLGQSEGVLSDPAPEALVVDLAAATVNIRARWWIQPPRQSDLFAVRDQALTEIKNALTAAGIDLPFPTQQILFHDQTEATDGDRTKQREGWPAGKGDAPEPRPVAAMLQKLVQGRAEQSVPSTNNVNNKNARGAPAPSAPASLPADGR